MRSTHTFATLGVTAAAYDEIAAKLRAAGYDHAFVEESEGVAIDMHGIGLLREETPSEAAAATARATAERYIEALTPSAETKAAYMGEFAFTREAQDEDGETFVEKILVPWTTVKEIMKAIVLRAEGLRS